MSDSPEGESSSAATTEQNQNEEEKDVNPQQKSLLDMSDDEIGSLDEDPFQLVFKVALNKVLKPARTTELGNKLDSLDGKTYLLLCSQKEDNTINKLMKYGLGFSLADKIYANLIAPRNTNQSKVGLLTYWPKSEIDLFNDNFLTNREAEILSFVSNSLVSDSSGLSPPLIISLQNFGSGKTKFGLNILNKAGSLLAKIETPMPKLVKRFLGARIVYVDLRFIFPSGNWNNSHENAIIDCVVSKALQQTELSETEKQRLYKIAWQDNGFPKFFSEVQRSEKAEWARKKEEERGDMTIKQKETEIENKEPGYPFLIVLDEVTKIEEFVPNDSFSIATRYRNLWLVLQKIQKAGSFVFVIGHSHYLFSLGSGLLKSNGLTSPSPVIRLHMDPLNADHIQEWWNIVFKVGIEKNPDDEKAVFERIAKETGGNPRMIHFTLEAIFGRVSRREYDHIRMYLSQPEYDSWIEIKSATQRELPASRLTDDWDFQSFIHFYIFAMFQIPVRLTATYQTRDNLPVSNLEAFRLLGISTKKCIIPVTHLEIEGGKIAKVKGESPPSQESLQLGNDKGKGKITALPGAGEEKEKIKGDMFLPSFPEDGQGKEQKMKLSWDKEELINYVTNLRKNITVVPNDELVIPVISPLATRSILKTLVRPFFASIDDIAAGDKMENAVKFGIAFRFLDQVFYDCKNRPLQFYFPYLIDSFCGNQVLEPVQFTFKNGNDVATVNESVHIWDFPKISKKGRRTLDQTIIDYITLSPQRKAFLNKKHKQDLFSSQVAVPPKLWPEILKLVKHGVLYQPGAMSASADFYVFWKGVIAGFQPKNVENFTTTDLVSEIKKVIEHIPQEHKVTLVILSRTLDRVLEDQLTAISQTHSSPSPFSSSSSSSTTTTTATPTTTPTTTSASYAFKLRASDMLTYKVTAKVAAKENADEEDANEEDITDQNATKRLDLQYTIPDNLEVYVLTKAGIKHFISPIIFSRLTNTYDQPLQLDVDDSGVDVRKMAKTFAWDFSDFDPKTNYFAPTKKEVSVTS